MVRISNLSLDICVAVRTEIQARGLLVCKAHDFNHCEQLLPGNKVKWGDPGYYVTEGGVGGIGSMEPDQRELPGL